MTTHIVMLNLDKGYYIRMDVRICTITRHAGGDVFQGLKKLNTHLFDNTQVWFLEENL